MKTKSNEEVIGLISSQFDDKFQGKSDCDENEHDCHCSAREWWIERMAEQLQLKDQACAERVGEVSIKLKNYFNFLTAVVYHLNNPESKMDIPSMIYETIQSKISQFPKDRVMTEQECLKLAGRKTTPNN